MAISSTRTARSPKSMWRVFAPVTVLAIMLIPCIFALDGAYRMARLDRAVSAYVSGRDDAAALTRTLDRSTNEDPAMVLMMARGHAALAIGAHHMSDRVRSLAEARRHIAAVLAARPNWGEALVVSASIASLDDSHPAAIAAYAASFRSAPYLRAESLWRIGFGAAHWRELDEATRMAMLREAGWVARITPKDRMTVLAILGDTPAGVRFATAQTRVGR